MAEFHINNQYGENFYQGDLHFHRPEERDHAAVAEKALARRDYRTARDSFAQALGSGADDPRTHYGLALALLDGKRPCLHGGSRVRDVQERLALSSLPEARVLSVLVEEDLHRGWLNGPPLPPAVGDFVSLLAVERADEVVRHLEAAGNRIWELLLARAERRLP